MSDSVWTPDLTPMEARIESLEATVAVLVKTMKVILHELEKK